MICKPESDVKEYGFQLQHQQNLKLLKLVGGIDYSVYDYQSERFESRGTPTTPYKPNNRYGNAAVFAQASYSNNRLDANLGARFDHFNYHIDANKALNSEEANNTYNTINPSLGIQYQIAKNLKVHTSAGTAFSVPDAYKTAGSYDVSVYFADWDYWWTQSYVGNPDLKPETSRSADLGLKYTNADNGLSFDITYFYNYHNNKIVDYTLDTGEKSYMNANHSVMDGVELDARYNIGVLFNNEFILELYTNWTYLLDANYTQKLTSTSGADSTVTQDLQFVRKSNGNFGMFFQNPMGISARVNARYIGSRFEEDSFGSLRPEITTSDYTTDGGYSASDKMLKHPDYLIFDLSAKYIFKKHFEVGCTISNLFDENYTEKDGYNMMGRQIRLNIGYKF